MISVQDSNHASTLQTAPHRLAQDFESLPMT